MPKNGFSTLEILHNNCRLYGEVALCGTRGWFYEEERGEHSAKIFNRELLRLEASLKAAGEREKFCFLHYPPLYQGYPLPGDPGPAGAVPGEPVLLRPSPRGEPPPGLLRKAGGRWSTHLVAADYIGFQPKKNLRLAKKFLGKNEIWAGQNRPVSGKNIVSKVYGAAAERLRNAASRPQEEEFMKVTNVEKKENSTVELTIQVEPDAFEAAVQKAYLKARKNIAVPGFRKGKAPRKIIEGMYGTAVFYEEAINDVYPAAYEAAVKEQNLEDMGHPVMDIVEVNKEKGLIFTPPWSPSAPEVTLKAYKGLTAPKAEVNVTRRGH